MDTIASRLRTALEMRGMKQAELVELTGIGESSISTYLRGSYIPKQKNIYKMAKALNVNEAWLIFDTLDSGLIAAQQHNADPAGNAHVAASQA